MVCYSNDLYEIIISISNLLAPPTMDFAQIEKMLNFDIDAPDYDDEGENDIDDDLESELANIVGKDSTRTSAARSPSPKAFAATSQTHPVSESSFVPTPVKQPNIGGIVSKSPAIPNASQKPIIESDVEVKPPVRQTLDPKSQKIEQIKQLQVEYKKAAVKAKQDKNVAEALSHMKVSKVYLLFIKLLSMKISIVPYL